MSQTVACFNPDRCGVKSHELNSQAYRECQKILLDRAEQGEVKVVIPPPPHFSDDERDEESFNSDIKERLEKKLKEGDGAWFSYYVDPDFQFDEGEIDSLLSGEVDKVMLHKFWDSDFRWRQDQENLEELWQELRPEDDDREFLDLEDFVLADQISHAVSARTDGDPVLRSALANSRRPREFAYDPSLSTELAEAAALLNDRLTWSKNPLTRDDQEVVRLGDQIISDYLTVEGEDEDELMGLESIVARDNFINSLIEAINREREYDENVRIRDITVAWESDDLAQMLPSNEPEDIFVSGATFHLDGYHVPVQASGYRAKLPIGAMDGSGSTESSKRGEHRYVRLAGESEYLSANKAEVSRK